MFASINGQVSSSLFV